MRELHGLREKPFRARLHCVNGSRDVAVTGDHDDDRALLAGPFEYLEAGDVRQEQVEEHHGRPLCLHEQHSFLAGARPQDVVSGAREVAPDRRADIGLVVDDQDFRHQFVTLASTAARSSSSNGFAITGRSTSARKRRDASL